MQILLRAIHRNGFLLNATVVAMICENLHLLRPFAALLGPRYC